MIKAEFRFRRKRKKLPKAKVTEYFLFSKWFENKITRNMV